MLGTFRYQGTEQAVPSTSLLESEPCSGNQTNAQSSKTLPLPPPNPISMPYKAVPILDGSGSQTKLPPKKLEVLAHQERMAVSIVTGPDRAHASPELSDGDLPVGHNVCKVGAHLWGRKKHNTQRPAQTVCCCELLGGRSNKKSSSLGLQANVNHRDGL